MRAVRTPAAARVPRFARHQGSAQGSITATDDQDIGVHETLLAISLVGEFDCRKRTDN